MRLHKAWILQAQSDVMSANALHQANADLCQVLAKCQQGVEKAVKGLIESLNVIGFLKLPVDSLHHVSRFVSAMLRAAEIAPKEHRLLRRQLLRLFPPHAQERIRTLDQVVPQYPKKGCLAVRNTEYPFQTSPTAWQAPCFSGVFTRGEVRRCLTTAEQVQRGAARIISALERAFPDLMAP